MHHSTLIKSLPATVKNANLKSLVIDLWHLRNILPH